MNKFLYELADIKFCTATPSRAKQREKITQWYVCANFVSDNVIAGETINNYIVPDEDFLLREEDIVIKRITPLFVNYVDSVGDDIYAGNNLIIISAKENIYPRYLAMILNDKIKDLSAKSSIGAVMKSISRTDLENVSIPMETYQNQIILGNAWYDSIELKKMKTRLAELEYIKVNYGLNKYITKKNGGKRND